MRNQKPYLLAKRPGEMRDRRIDRNDKVEIRHESRGIGKISDLSRDINQVRARPTLVRGQPFDQLQTYKINLGRERIQVLMKQARVNRAKMIAFVGCTAGPRETNAGM